MADKYLETILDEVRDHVKLVMMIYSQTDDPSLLDIGIGNIEKCIKLMEGSDKKSESITEFYHSLRGMRDEMIDEKDRYIETLRLL